MARLFQRHRLVLAAALIAAAAFVTALVAERFCPDESYPRTNYSLIEDGLYLGGILEAPPPGTRAVLNVCETKDPYRAEAHRWEPIPDASPAPDMDWLRQQVEFIDTERRAGRAVFVHCRAGTSRSAMVVAAYLMARDGLGRDEALALLRAKRPRVGPNFAFLCLLLEWEQSLRAAREAGQ